MHSAPRSRQHTLHLYREFWWDCTHKSHISTDLVHSDSTHSFLCAEPASKGRWQYAHPRVRRLHCLHKPPARSATLPQRWQVFFRHCRQSCLAISSPSRQSLHHNATASLQWKHNAGSLDGHIFEHDVHWYLRLNGPQKPPASSATLPHRWHAFLRPDCLASYRSGNIFLKHGLQ